MIRKMLLLFFSIIFLLGCASENQPNRDAQGVSKSVAAEESGIVPASAPTTGKVEIIGGDEASLRNFIQRWFAPMYPVSTSEGGTTIWIGRMPEKLPVDFPIPTEAQIIASVQDLYTNLDVLMEADTPLNDFQASFAQILESAGWSPAPQQSHGGGFVAEADPWFVYCNDQEGAALTLQAYENAAGKTDLRLTLYTENIKYMCDPDLNQGMDQAYNMLPVLKMPAGSLMTSGGSSSGDGSAESTTDIKTELSPKVLAAHFALQMKNGGWQSLNGSSLDNLAWSSWSTHDDQGEEWRGTLILLVDQVKQDHVFALIRVIKVQK